MAELTVEEAGLAIMSVFVFDAYEDFDNVSLKLFVLTITTMISRTRRAEKQDFIDNAWRLFLQPCRHRA